MGRWRAPPAKAAPYITAAGFRALEGLGKMIVTAIDYPDPQA